MSTRRVSAPCAADPAATAPSSLRTAPPLRVGLVVHTFDVGGLERCAANLCRTLSADRFEPEVFCLHRSGTAAAWLAGRSVPVHELGKRSGQDWGVVRRLADRLRERRIDLVHSHNWGTLLETVLARRQAGVRRHLHAEHGLELSDLRLPFWKRWLRSLAVRWALARVDGVAVISQGIEERIASLKPSRTPLQRIDNGVDAPAGADDATARDRLRNEFDLPRDAVVCGSVGRLAEVKNFPLLIEAVAEIAEAHPRLHLLLVGDGPQRPELERLVCEHGLQRRVRLVGRREDVGACLRAMDLYVNCSHSEGLCLAILEAMACGLPLVVSDVGENRRLAEGDGPSDRCGRSFPAGDAAALADAVAKLLAAPSLAASWGRTAANRFQRCFTAARMCDAYAALYERLAPPAERRNRVGRRVEDALPTIQLAEIEELQTPLLDSEGVHSRTVDLTRLDTAELDLAALDAASLDSVKQRKAADPLRSDRRDVERDTPERDALNV